MTTINPDDLIGEVKEPPQLRFQTCVWEKTMNAHQKGAGSDAIDVQTILRSLPGLGYFNDDIQAQLKETAKSITQDIVDLLSAQYKDARKPATPPDALWQPLRGEAYKIAADHCEALAQELREAAKDPNMKL